MVHSINRPTKYSCYIQAVPFVIIMAEPEDELVKYKRLYEELKARVKELERQNSKLKVQSSRHIRLLGLDVFTLFYF